MEGVMTTEATRMTARILLPPTCMVAAAVLVKGYADTGDGFSAGVILSLGILLQYLAFGSDVADRLPIVRHAPRLAVAGLAISLLVTFLPALFGDPVMSHRPGPNEKVIHLGTVELLTAVAFDIGVFLLVVGFSIGVIDLIAHTIDRTASAQP
jgi:multicomponent Na+:H+ antiporter subunit B